MVTPSAS
ncbi:hypothetical protein E2C01_064491 [Portunus trituberculatus]|nr:hypothetical protein [Portunus trituberculatus]